MGIYTNSEETIMRNAGGRQRFLGVDEIWDFGWIAPEDYTPAMAAMTAHSAQRFVPFKLEGKSRIADHHQAFLWLTWKDPRVLQQTKGLTFPGNHQFTGSCFPAKTPIRMADGSEKSIETISVGDMVISHTGASRRVVETMQRQYNGDMISIQPVGYNHFITMTADHPVATLKNNNLIWKKADNLEVEDYVLIGGETAIKNGSEYNLTSLGYSCPIQKITRTQAHDLTVYDFEVEEDHSFLANDLTVHNCVGVSGGNITFATSAIEVARMNEPEQAVVPFWPFAYGRSRYRSGIGGRGEGSTGSGMAEALTTDGVLDSNLDSIDEPVTAGLPQLKVGTDGMLDVGSSIEMEWSDGGRIPEKYLTVARRNIFKSASRIRSADEGREAIANGYYMLFCGMWGGLMRCPIEGSPGRLMNRRASSWSHCQVCIGWEDHPQFGEIFYILNQWGDAHGGQCPSGAPVGGYWIKKAEFDWQARTGECIAMSQFSGYPTPDWEIPWLI